MKARSVARELALLGVSQLPDARAGGRAGGSERAQKFEVSIDEYADSLDSASELVRSQRRRDALIMKAMRMLSADARGVIETAEGELQRSERLVLESETRTTDMGEVRSRIQPAIPLAETAINRVGGTLEMLLFAQRSHRKDMVAAKEKLVEAAKNVELADQMMGQHEQKILDVEKVRSQIQEAIQSSRIATESLKKTLLPEDESSNKKKKKAAILPENLAQLIPKEEIRTYAGELLDTWILHWQDIDIRLDDAMEKWNIRRLARVDRDILRLAMMEIIYMKVPKKVAIDEAIEMAKRYSDEDGYRFINGVLRRATDKLDN